MKKLPRAFIDTGFFFSVISTLIAGSLFMVDKHLLISVIALPLSAIGTILMLIGMGEHAKSLEKEIERLKEQNNTPH